MSETTLVRNRRPPVEITFCCKMLCVSAVCSPQMVARFARVVNVCNHSLRPTTSVKTAQIMTSHPWALSQVRDVGSANVGSEITNAKMTRAPLTVTAEIQIVSPTPTRKYLARLRYLPVSGACFSNKTLATDSVVGSDESSFCHIKLAAMSITPVARKMKSLTTYEIMTELTMLII